MAQARYLLRNINQIPKPSSIQAKQKPQKPKSANPHLLYRKQNVYDSDSHHLHLEDAKTQNSLNSRKQDVSLITKKAPRARRRLINLSTAEGKWGGDWSCDYLFTLRDLSLSDLVDEEHNDTQVSINLCIQRHASFGLSVDGRINTSFTRKCSMCSSPYCKKIDTSFSVWVLASSRDNTGLPVIGGDDPSVIYVKPGYEANLDTLIEETIRLAADTTHACSEACEKSEQTVQYVGSQYDATIDKRWYYSLLELKKTL